MSGLGSYCLALGYGVRSLACNLESAFGVRVRTLARNFGVWLCDGIELKVWLSSCVSLVMA